jgi:hypothetical protein
MAETFSQLVSGDQPGAELKVEVANDYSAVVKEKLTILLPMLKQDQVKLATVESLRFDPVTASIIVSIVGAVGPVLVKEIFKTIREIVRDSRKDHTHHKKAARAIIRHKGREHVIETGDEDFPDE